MNIKTPVVPIFQFIFVILILVVHGLGEAGEQRPWRRSKTYTNDDLEKYRQQVGEPDTAKPVKPNGTAYPIAAQLDPITDQKDWVDQLERADHKVEKAKFEEARFSQSVGDFQKRMSEAKTNFQKQTAQWQIADSEKNLARAIEVRKQAETERAKLIERASKSGVQTADRVAKKTNQQPTP